MTHKTKSSIIFPRNVRVGDLLRTTAGMREVLNIIRDSADTYITVQSPATSNDQTVLRFPVRRAAKVAVQRAVKAR